MSEPEQLKGVATYIFTWQALSDACPKCRSLNGKEYRDQNIYQNTLWDVIWGDIWDLNADHSLTHPNCRCQLTVRVDFDWSKWNAFKELNETFEQNGGTPVSSVTEARKEIEELANRMERMERSLPRARKLLFDITTLASTMDLETDPAIRRRISLLFQVKAAYDVVQVARLAAGDPFAWIGAGVTVATTTIRVVDELDARAPEY